MSLSSKRIPGWRQLRSLGSVLSPSERRWVIIFGWLASISAIVVLTVFLSGHLGRVARAGGTLTEGIVGSPQFINPVLARPDTADADVVNVTFRGLMRVGQNPKYIPELADNLVVSPDGKTYTVTLRPGLVWSDGQPLTADDVVYTYQTMADAQYKSPWQSALKPVNVEKKDGRTIIFRIDHPTPGFMNLLTLGLIPQHAWGDQTGATFSLAELNLKPIGNGPYKFSSLTKDRSGAIKSLTVIKNKDYRPGAPLIDHLVFKFYGSQESAVQALASDSVDTLGNLQQDDVAMISKHHVVTNIPLAQITGIFFNQRSNPALKVKEVRRALSMSIDRQALVHSPLHDQGRVAYGPILPGFIGYNPNLRHDDNQAEQAKSLLDQAGWKTMANGIRQKGSQQLTFVLTTVDEPALVALAHAVAKSWQAIGAQVEVKTVDPTRIEVDTIGPRQYEALLFGQRLTADSDPYAYWHSTQQRDPGFALAIFFNKNLDKDLDDGHKTLDPVQRQKDYLDFQNILIDEVPAVITDQSVYAYAHPKGLHGFNDRLLIDPTNRFDDISHWYLHTSLTWASKKK